MVGQLSALAQEILTTENIRIQALFHQAMTFSTAGTIITCLPECFVRRMCRLASGKSTVESVNAHISIYWHGLTRPAFR